MGYLLTGSQALLRGHFLGFAFLRRHERLTPALVAAAALGVAGTAFIVGF